MPQKNVTHQMAAACEKQGSAGDGRSRANKREGEEMNGSRRGRETEADPKQPGVALWRRRETDKDGTHGQDQDRQQRIANSGGRD